MKSSQRGLQNNQNNPGIVFRKHIPADFCFFLFFWNFIISVLNTTNTTNTIHPHYSGGEALIGAEDILNLGK